MKYETEHPVKNSLKGFIPFLLFIPMMLFIVLMGHIEDSSNNGEKYITPLSSEECQGLNYQDVQTKFSDAGFTNILLEKDSDVILGIMADDGEVEKVTINGNTTFSKGSHYNSDASIIIKYHAQYGSDSEAKTTQSTNENIEQTQTTEGILTVDNCPELASILSNKNDYDESYIAFSEKYQGNIIQFNGCIEYINKHENYKTRYDILIGSGDYNPNSQSGPSFQLNDVGAYNLGLGSLNDVESEFQTGQNIVMTAKVGKYNKNALLFYLDPIEMTHR